MYKLLIVDDEEMIRDGIAKGIKWENLGFEVIGQACNGLEAIELVEQSVPDAIFHYYKGIVYASCGEEAIALEEFRKGVIEMDKAELIHDVKSREFSMKCLEEYRKRM